MPRKILSIKLWTSLLLAPFAFGAHAEQASLTTVGDALCRFRVTRIVHIAQYGLDFAHGARADRRAAGLYPLRGHRVQLLPGGERQGHPSRLRAHHAGGSEKYPAPALDDALLHQTYNSDFNAFTEISDAPIVSASPRSPASTPT